MISRIDKIDVKRSTQDAMTEWLRELGPDFLRAMGRVFEMTAEQWLDDNRDAILESISKSDDWKQAHSASIASERAMMDKCRSLEAELETLKSAF